MQTLPPDPVIDEIRETRHQISERFDHDPKKLFEHYLRLQEELRDRWVERSEVPAMVLPSQDLGS